jgi:spermidine/putrescine ABC transporter ATP-binding subunit
MAILELRNLTKRYGSILGVGPVSLSVNEGEFISLLGPSGCGKTTTLRCVGGFEHPTSGDILFDGESIVDRPPHQRNMGLVFQSYALFPHLSIFENVAFGLRLRRRLGQEITRRVREALALVNLAGLESRYPNQISGGQQQRVALARALVLEPRLLLLDEPLSNLDFKLRIQMREEIKKLQQRLGITTIHVTHDQSEALTLSTRVVVLNHGVVQQVGAPREIYEKPATPFVAEFIGASNLLSGVIEQSDGSLTAVRVNGLTVRSIDSLPESALHRNVVTILIRPERIRLVRAQESNVAQLADPMINRLSGRVTEVSFLGEDLQIEFQVDNGPYLKVSVKAGTADEELARGDRAVACILPRDVQLLSIE